MSDLSGHSILTARALRELRSECADNSLVVGTSGSSLPMDVVMRDVVDILILGHWADFGQAHHFMRRFDAQSPYQAWEEGCEWIRSNARDSARELASLLPRGLVVSASRNGVAAHAGVRQTCQVPQVEGGGSELGRWAQRETISRAASLGPWTRQLGNAVHALEDSFAAGHVERGPPVSSDLPGCIEHIRRYAGAEREGHEQHDEEWWDERQKRFSPTGRFAIDAVKDLVARVLSSALAGRRGGQAATEWWPVFVQRWLKPGQRLSQQRDLTFEFIERHCTVLRVGDQVMTLSMDEEALADALHGELGVNFEQVFQVFRRLEQYHYTDVDQVAELYVARVRRNERSAASLKAHRQLIELLIRVMHMTDGDQAKQVVFLSGLRGR